MTMVLNTGKSPVRQKLETENFEAKYDRRLERHEILRSRHNTTSCRQDNLSWGKEQDRHSPREQEFFKRRHLWIDELGDKQIRSPPKLKKPSPHFPMKQNVFKVQSKDEDVFSTFQVSWNHNRSQSYPFDCRIGLSQHCLGPIYSKNKKNDVTVKERGVQTIQETAAICLKRESSQQTDCATAVMDGELLQLSEYLMEALHRERNLKKKLCVLQELLGVLVQTAEKSWMAQLNEDNLKCKLVNLENQLFFCTRSFPKKSVKPLLLEMENQKMKYQEKAKESLQKLSDDKIAIERQLQKAQMSLSVSSDECELWKEEYEKLKTDWIELSNKYCDLKDERSILHSKLQWFGSQESQCQQLHNRIQGLEKKQIELQALNEQLQEDSELQEEQLRSLQVRLRNSEEKKLELQKQIKTLQTGLGILEQRSMSDTTALQVSEAPEVDLQNDQLRGAWEKLLSREKKHAGLKAELELITDEYRSCQRKLKQCREELKKMTRRKPKKRCCFWMPIFMVIFSIVTAFFISSYIA